MELQVTILNFLLYDDKDTGEKKIRIGYIINDKSYMQNTLKFKGLAECSVFLDKADCWDSLSFELCGNPAVFCFEEVPSLRNPLRKYNKLKTIKTKNGVIDIIQ